MLTKLLDNRITGEPDMTPAQRNNYALLDKISKDKGGARAVLKRYEAVEQPTLASSPAPADAASPLPTPTPLESLPPGVKVQDLRAAFNAYEALLNTVKRQLFLVLNNNVLWTGVLGFVFIARVKRELSMPTFSETLLGLIGLSSLTYIALKVPELKKVEAM